MESSSTTKRSSGWSDPEELLDRFDVAWQQGNRPSIDDFLADDRHERAELLFELVLMDLEHRIKQGEAARVEQYLERYALLANDRQHVVDLIASEFDLRRRREPQLMIEECLERFPDYREDLTLRLSDAPQPTPARFPARTNCPHCQSPIATRGTEPDGSIICPACGNSVSLESDRNLSWSPANLPKLGKFELLEAIGRGAFGTVYRAKDSELDRIVAVKIPRSWTFSSTADEDRFEREARNVARLSHPGIVPVFEVGRDDAFPYIVSEFVEGVTLSDALSARRFEFQAAAELIADVADSLEYAHQHGVIHRDLKPANIMLERRSPAESRTDLEFQPRLLDFGLARNIGRDATMTQEGQILGTPAYMAPEQARGEAHTADGRADVYSLGAIFFALLTGVPPFRGNARMLLHQVIHDDPPSPRTLNGDVPRDLETICMKCLEKDPKRRFATAGELSAELRRSLRGEAIESRPISRRDRFRRWCERNKTVAALTFGLFFALTAGLVGIATQWVRAESLAESESRQHTEAVAATQQAVDALEREKTARDAADTARRSAEELKTQAEQLAANEREQRKRTRRHLYVSHMNLVQQAWNDANTSRMIDLLSRYLPQDHEDEDLRTFVWHYWWRQSHRSLRTFPTGQRNVRGFAISPDRKRFVLISSSRTAAVYDIATGKVALELPGHRAAVTSAGFSADGLQIATGSAAGTITIWNAKTGRRLLSFNAHRNHVSALAWETKKHRLISAGDDKLLNIWDPQTGKRHAALTHKRTRPIRTLDVTPDGDTLIAGGYTFENWNLRTHTLRKSVSAHRGSVNAAHISPDGTRIVSGGIDREVRVSTVNSLGAIKTIRNLSDAPFAVAFSPDGSRIAAAGGDRTIRVWRSANGQQVAEFRGHNVPIRGLSFLDEGKSLLSLGDDGRVMLWDPIAGEVEATLGTHFTRLDAVAFSPDGTQVATGGQGHRVRIWDVASGTMADELLSGQQVITSLLWRGKRIFATCDQGLIQVWDRATGQHTERPLHGKTFVWNIGSSADGAVAIASDESKRVRIWNVATGAVRQTMPGCGKRLAVSSDGTTAVVADDDGFTLIEIATGRTQAIPNDRPARWVSIAFAPGGQSFAVGDNEGNIELWSIEQRSRIATLRGHTADVYAVAYSPDGKTLASAGGDRGIKLWDLRTNEIQSTLSGHASAVFDLAFSPDGSNLVSVGNDKTVRIWRTGTAPKH